MRKRAELLAHIQNTNSQYNLPEIGKKLAYKANRDGVAERFPEPAVQKSIEVDLTLIDTYDRLLTDLELDLVQTGQGARCADLLPPALDPRGRQDPGTRAAL